jgi:hypothetical protein
MDASWLGDIAFWVFLIGAAASALLAGMSRSTLAKAAGCLALAGGLALIAAICLLTGRPPLSGTYESLSLMALVLAGLAFRSLFGREASQLLSSLSWGGVALLLAVLIWIPHRINPDWFIYQFGWTRAFFTLRLVAMAVFFYSALAALAWTGGNGKNVENGRFLLNRARRFLLLGTAIFLVGEVCGFYWCLCWRGDYWLWNRNFLESTMIFLLASAALHLPPKLAARPQAARWAYCIPGLLAVTAYFLHQITG